MYDIYYAHHQWKYNTQEEAYELELIRRYFPNATVFNPSTDLKIQKFSTEKVIMDFCLETVRNSDILIFSSLDGCVGKGVYHEVQEALATGKIVFYIYQDDLHSAFTIRERDEKTRTDRLYGYVDIDLW